MTRAILSAYMDSVQSQKEILKKESSEILSAWQDLTGIAKNSCGTYMQTIHIWWWMRALHISLKAKMDQLRVRARDVGFSDEAYHNHFCLLPSQLDAEMECLVNIFQRKVDEYEPVVDTSVNDIAQFISVIKLFLHRDAPKLLDIGEMLRVPCMKVDGHPDVQKVLQFGKDITLRVLQQCAAAAKEKGEVVKWTPNTLQEGQEREVVRDDSMIITVCEVRIGDVTRVTQVAVAILEPNPFGTIVYVLTRDLRVRYYDPVYEHMQLAVTAWVPPFMDDDASSVSEHEDASSVSHKTVSDDEDSEQMR